MILLLARKTKGDHNFYDRWKDVDVVMTSLSPKYNSKITTLVVDQRVIVDKDLVSRLPKLRYICTANTGHTHIKVTGYEIISLRGETEFLQRIRSVSEHVFNLILRSYRPLNTYGNLLSGKSILVIGPGRIGLQVIHLARAFNMSVMSWDEGLRNELMRKRLRAADIVTIHVPETEKTRNLLNASFVNVLKKGCLVINTSRGSLIDEVTLAKRLHKGELMAAVDVIEDKKTLNHSVPNLIISDHIAGSAIEDRIKTDEFIVDKLKKTMAMNELLDTLP